MRRRVRFGLAAVILLAAATRLFGIASASFWEDEAATVIRSQRPTTWLLGSAFDDPGNPPGYYVLMRGWLGFLGVHDPAELAYRLPAAIFSTLTIPLVFFLTRRLTHNAGLAVFAAAWLAVSAHQVTYAQEARAYALLGLITPACVLLLSDALGRGGVWRWLLYALLAGIMPYFHHQGWFILFGLGVGGLAGLAAQGWQSRRAIEYFGAELLVAGAAVWPLFRYTLPQMMSGRYASWQPYASMTALGEGVFDWTVGGWYWVVCPCAVPPLLVALAAAVPLAAVALTWRTDRRVDTSVLVATLVAGAGAFLVMATLKPLWQIRYLFAFQSLFIVSAVSLGPWLQGLWRSQIGPIAGRHWPRAVAGWGLAAVLLLLPNVQHVGIQYAYPWKADYRGAAATIATADPDCTAPVLVFRWAYMAYTVYSPQPPLSAPTPDEFIALAREQTADGRAFAVLSETQGPLMHEVLQRLREEFAIGRIWHPYRIVIVEVLGPAEEVTTAPPEL